MQVNHEEFAIDGVKFSSAGKADRMEYATGDYLYEVMENDSGSETP